MVTSCGGPWWLTCASPTPPWVALSHAPRGGVWATPPTHHPHSMVLALRGCTLLVPFSVCLPASVCLLSAAPRGCALVSRFQACHGPNPLPVLLLPVRRHRRVLDEGELP